MQTPQGKSNRCGPMWYSSWKANNKVLKSLFGEQTMQAGRAWNCSLEHNFSELWLTTWQLLAACHGWTTVLAWHQLLLSLPFVGTWGGAHLTKSWARNKCCTNSECWGCFFKSHFTYQKPYTVNIMVLSFICIKCLGKDPDVRFDSLRLCFAINSCCNETPDWKR